MTQISLVFPFISPRELCARDLIVVLFIICSFSKIFIMSGLRRVAETGGNAYDTTTFYRPGDGDMASLRSGTTNTEALNEGHREHLLGICDKIHVQVELSQH